MRNLLGRRRFLQALGLATTAIPANADPAPIDFDNNKHIATLKGRSAYNSGNEFDMCWSELTLSSLRSAGLLDNMVDGLSPPSVDQLWLDKNYNPAILKEWNLEVSNWAPVTSQTLFGGVSWRGGWSAAATYRRGDIVNVDGSIWIAKDSGLNQKPVDGPYWDRFIQSPVPIDIETPEAAASQDLSSLSIVRINRWSLSSEIAPADYKRVTTRPSHQGRFQDSSGNWWELSASKIYAEMLGASPNASPALNSSAVNAAIMLQHLRGGGEVLLSKPGTYLLANTSPYPIGAYFGLSESDANWWLNRRAIWIPYDNIALRLGEGVTLKVADGQNCHAIQMGQFSLGMSGVGPTIPAISVSNSCIIGKAWQIDMNGSKQNSATGDKDHYAGIIVNHGSERIEICGGRIFNSSYYGIGFEGAGSDTLKGFRSCYVHDMLIEDCKADGFDAKDFGTVSADNVLARVTVRNVGNGGGAYLSGQAGIDTRGGWTVEDCTVYFDDVFKGQRTGFRSQYAPDYAQSADPTHFVRCRAVGNAKDHPGTIGFRLTGRNARADDCVASGLNDGFRVSSPRHVLKGVTARNCVTAYRFFTDAGASWDADNSILRDSFVEGCDVGWVIESGVSGVQIDGGGVADATTPLINLGTFTHIKGVAGFRTSARSRAFFPVGTNGIKTVEVSHDLPIIPLKSDVTVTLEGGSVSDFGATIAIINVDATKVTVTVNVFLASKTVGGSGLARVVVESMQ
ncbi:hypothetical protein [Agrobacterium tumefaciens]|uniref:hypothetical protein n=1 Tax=Agrobacterium tumefaciens TaxID=358 RepID=UPI002202E2B8|nr:hypothetical protein FY131_14080 [Agrobacterium tumefaciens]